MQWSTVALLGCRANAPIHMNESVFASWCVSWCVISVKIRGYTMCRILEWLITVSVKCWSNL